MILIQTTHINLYIVILVSSMNSIKDQCQEFFDVSLKHDPNNIHALEYLDFTYAYIVAIYLNRFLTKIFMAKQTFKLLHKILILIQNDFLILVYKFVMSIDFKRTKPISVI